MKATLLLFCIIFVLENFVIANNAYNKQPLTKDLYHVKKERFINGPKLINKRVSKAGILADLRRSSSLLAEPWTLDEPRTKKQTVDDGYTVFPPNIDKLAPNVPSSFYFQEHPHDEEPKLRVKKVLPDFWNPTHDRKKRSPDETPKDKVEDKKAEVKEVKSEKPVAKSDDAKKDVKDTEAAVKPKVENSRRSGGGRQREVEQPSRRLIAARDTIIENYPYVVSIQKDGEHWCAGAILNQRLVITTANCVWKSDRMSRMRIRVGSRDLDRGGQEIGISEVLKHPNWSIRRGPDFDIALLLTTEFIKFSHSVHAVDLPNRMMKPVFEDAWVASWGADRRDGVYEKRGLTLQVFHARVMDREKCNNITMRYGVIVTENFICLEQYGRRAPCTRDTGAPAVSDGVLWGLASWGIRKLCGTERFPAMFTYVASQNNMDFIINGTRYMMSEERLSPFLDRYPFAHARNNSAMRV
ncbi:trypsin domain-containing protein [Phthorimaea operculella]|nr:trypsin domain-containing protein [Phthorimaea operculella]